MIKLLDRRLAKRSRQHYFPHDSPYDRLAAQAGQIL
jgi:hypothetical protein